MTDIDDPSPCSGWQLVPTNPTNDMMCAGIAAHGANTMDVWRAMLRAAPNATAMPRRPVVEAFADAMEQKLRANDHKGGWQDDAPHELLRRLIEETAELVRVMRPEKGSADFYAAAMMLDAAAHLLRRWGPGLRTTADPAQARGEAADVGNFAMMVADRLGAIRAAEEALRP